MSSTAYIGHMTQETEFHNFVARSQDRFELWLVGWCWGLDSEMHLE